ncbi:uncharacterized protein ACRADG_009747 [Cochliomyia hominivorax]
MNYLILLTIFLLTINAKISMQSENNLENWFLHDNSIFYIETVATFTSYYCQGDCRDKDMMAKIMPNTVNSLFERINEIYGNFSSFWTYNINKAGSNACFKLTQNRPFYVTESCSTLMGFICKRHIEGGTLHYKNGTILEINIENVNRYCDPHSNEYDDILDYCVIHFSEK